MQRFFNNIEVFLTSPLSNIATTLTINTIPNFLDSSHTEFSGVRDHVFATIKENSTIEIIKMVYASDTGATTTYTITRGQEGTTASSFTISAKISCNITKDYLNTTVTAAKEALYGTSYNPVTYSKYRNSVSVSNGIPLISNGVGGTFLLVPLSNGATAAVEPTWTANTIQASNGVNYKVSYFAANSVTQNTFDTTLLDIEPMAATRRYSVGDFSTAIGDGNAFGSNSVSIGRISNVLDYTSRISGLQVIGRDDNNYFDLLSNTASEVTLFSPVINLKTVAAGAYSTILPFHTKFYCNEVGIILTDYTGTISAKPFISFGISGSNASILASIQTTKGAIGGRDRYTTLLNNDGVGTLTASVVTAATGTGTISGRFYFKGMLVEDQ